MRDFSLMARRTDITQETGKTRNAKEDMDRMKGDNGASLVYELPATIRTCTVYAFLPEELANFRFHISSDGQTYRTIEAQRKDFFSGEGQYGYFKPVRYQADAGHGRFIKIEFTDEAQISRIEIACGDGK
jgi:mannan endo-1,4-beta-mannosidase